MMRDFRDGFNPYTDVRKPKPQVTVADLLNALSHLNPDATIEVEVESTDTYSDQKVTGFRVSSSFDSILLTLDKVE